MVNNMNLIEKVNYNLEIIKNKMKNIYEICNSLSKKEFDKYDDLSFDALSCYHRSNKLIVFQINNSAVLIEEYEKILEDYLNILKQYKNNNI